mmetsp:Transcript_69344/g.130831  ORF Transcript_69344/g.130831 Transcript_69344/m.130831 type:complete len:116 (-) Transcript_69344:32-379(-)
MLLAPPMGLVFCGLFDLGSCTLWQASKKRSVLTQIEGVLLSSNSDPPDEGRLLARVLHHEDDGSNFDGIVGKPLCFMQVRRQLSSKLLCSRVDAPSMMRQICQEEPQPKREKSTV